MRNFDLRPVCRKEREMRKTGGGPVMKKHNRWDGTKMVSCAGSGKPPRPFSVRGT